MGRGTRGARGNCVCYYLQRELQGHLKTGLLNITQKTGVLKISFKTGLLHIIVTRIKTILIETSNLGSAIECMASRDNEINRGVCAFPFYYYRILGEWSFCESL